MMKEIMNKLTEYGVIAGIRYKNEHGVCIELEGVEYYQNYRDERLYLIIFKKQLYFLHINTAMFDTSNERIYLNLSKVEDDGCKVSIWEYDYKLINGYRYFNQKYIGDEKELIAYIRRMYSVFDLPPLMEDSKTQFKGCLSELRGIVKDWET